MSRLSIIIAYAGDTVALEDSLVSVLENRPQKSEVIVVLGGRYDDPYGLKGEITFVEAPPRGGFARTINTGMAAANAPVVHVLASGIEVGEGWAEPALARFEDPAVAAVSPLVVRRGHPEQVVLAGLDYRWGGGIRAVEGPLEVVTALPPAITAPHPGAAFFRRAAWQAAEGLDGGLDESAAAVDLGLLWRFGGLAAVVEPCSRVTAPEHFAPKLRGLRAARGCERIFWRWAAEIGWVRSLTCHPLVILADAVESYPRAVMFNQLIGRLLGSLAIGAHRGNAQRLARLGACLRPGNHASLRGPHFSPRTGNRRCTA